MSYQDYKFYSIKNKYNYYYHFMCTNNKVFVIYENRFYIIYPENIEEVKIIPYEYEFINYSKLDQKYLNMINFDIVNTTYDYGLFLKKLFNRELSINKILNS